MNGFDAFFIEILLLLIVSHNNGLLLNIIKAKAKWSPFIALLLASVILGIITGMDIRDVADAVQTGVGNPLGNVDRGFGAVFGERFNME
ncbi:MULTISPECIES: GntT/GntP/DsdX family permease [Peribacillus]|uniref:GntT/GntP/DsdX family permease n=1 Tax=Peribacillus TaxID=2675229 RepID=UPI001070C49B|nr:hypothetical protein [Peribacillus frigoritolerans]MEC0347015.1 hypothetical protein [Peribacillus castrilensis]TFH61905.1 hypothetical protein E4J71_10770 [Peribacillus frigoritolerans]